MHWNLSIAAERKALVLELDTVVRLATANHLYVLIDYHDVGRLDLEHALQFWDIVAPRYAEHPNVLFELANEPVGYHPESYTDEDLRKQERLFTHVRAIAPATHLVMLSFANTAIELVPDGNPVIDVLDRIDGIDWSNASVGIHPYRTLSSKILLDIRDRAPVVMTELDLPVHAGGSTSLHTSIDAAEYGHEVMERHGISWFTWGIEGFQKFESRFERGVLEDARSKGYLWVSDAPPKRRRSEGSVVFGLFREPALREALDIMGVAWRHVYRCITLATLAAILDGVMLLMLLPTAQGAAGGSFEFVWRNRWLSAVSAHVPSPFLTYTGTFLTLAATIFLIGLAKNAAYYGLHLYVSHLYRVFSARLANAAFRRYLLFGKAFFDKHAPGKTASILDYHHDLLNLLKKLLELVSDTLVVAISLFVMAIISWKLTLVSLLVFPTMYLIRQWIARRTSKPIEESQANTLRIAERSFEIHRAMPLFRAFTMEEQAARQHAAVMEEIRKSDFRVWLYEGLLPRAQEITTFTALLLVLILAFALERDQVSPARLFVFFFISRLALPRLGVYHEVELEFSRKMPRVRLFLSVFNDNGKFMTAPGVRDFDGIRDAIYFQKLTFSYPDREPVLRQVEFRVPQGQITAIVGPSGSGKTTLANLLLRYYDVAPHTIALDGLCVREFTAESLRRGIAVVSQDVMLVDDTLRGNIVLGADREVTSEELDRVVRDAALTDVVLTLPLGLDTPIGADGVTLSGGQRQRVALARAMLKRASILVLDEATSSLDAETEELVQTAIERASSGCTVLLISHRMTTIKRADQVVVLDRGRVVESGGVHEVLARNGAFYKMWQAQKFDWEDVSHSVAALTEVDV